MYSSGHVLPAGLSAVMPVYLLIQQFSKAIVVDIGGLLADKNIQADMSVCDSMENVVITLYNRIKVKSQCGLRYAVGRIGCGRHITR